MTRDWQAWHRHYDDPSSSLSRRLETVRRLLARELREAGEGPGDPVRLLSLCAGDGRDVLPVLAGSPAEVRATLVELDPDLAAAARTTARELGVAVDVRCADAGTTDAYAGRLPVDVLLLCGVFGNVVDADVETTVAALPALLAPDALVLWTRGRHVEHDPTEQEGDPADFVRALFLAGPFTEVDLVAPDDADFRVGAHRFTGTSEPVGRGAPGVRLFDFVRAGHQGRPPGV